ncbi:MAG: hypothetical protein AVDCRST_MAG51-709 [uncultured Ramlibacter sp.]|uniref:Uncharacterized protein n=1 Tax=uncultured Ramlibacter sp. TaxID=260755 RepID=A0A6J4NYL5_9BURK|nr:MAG: hypothetical protein AVDCRST_MAG51-709 [uncultured Ramlibacter sp.]
MVTALACWPAAHVLAEQDNPRPRHKVSAGELHRALSARFPLRFGIPGMVEMRISAPSLHLRPARNQLGAGLLAEVSGVQARQSETGEIDVVFALRYERADQTVRGHQLEVLDMRLPGLPPDPLRAVQRMLPAMAREAVGEVVLHQFTARELALPDTMGFEPEQLTVLEDGLLVSFGPKLRR